MSSYTHVYVYKLIDLTADYLLFSNNRKLIISNIDVNRDIFT